jgi:hypothetical protein
MEWRDFGAQHTSAAHYTGIGTLPALAPASTVMVFGRRMDLCHDLVPDDPSVKAITIVALVRHCLFGYFRLSYKNSTSLVQSCKRF